MKEAPRFLILDDTRFINLEKISSIELLPKDKNDNYKYLKDGQTPDFVLAICLGCGNYHYLADDAAANFLMKSRRIIFGGKYPSAFVNLINIYNKIKDEF